MAELYSFELVDEVQKFNLVLELYFDELLLQTFEYPHGNEHHRHFLLADDEIPYLFGELDWEVIKKQADEPLEQPQVISYVALLQDGVDLRHLLFKQLPKNLAIQLHQREVVLV